jgi:hypothetical protein
MNKKTERTIVIIHGTFKNTITLLVNQDDDDDDDNLNAY